MPADGFTISELDHALDIKNGDLLIISQDNSGTETSYYILITDLGDKLNNNLQYVTDLKTTAKTIIGAINELKGTVLTDTLEAGETSLVFQSVAITATSVVEVWTNTYGVSPTNIVTVDGYTTLTFSAQENNVEVGVVIKNGLV